MVDVKSFAMSTFADSQNSTGRSDFGAVYHVTPARSSAPVLLVCEHASNRIPADLNNLGVSAEVLDSHAAWDPGALGVAEALARKLSAPLFSGRVSRLVYDCNRPPQAPSAVPERSEIYDIPGNTALSAAERARRVDLVYRPFAAGLADLIAQRRAALGLLVTIHSFTPVYNGVPRQVEIGLLHGKDARFVEMMMENPPKAPTHEIRVNEPYGAADGVAHTLDAHGHANGLPNVMIEIRNDLIRTGARQDAMAELLSPWITRSLAKLTDAGAAA